MAVIFELSVRIGLFCKRDLSFLAMGVIYVLSILNRQFKNQTHSKK